MNKISTYSGAFVFYHSSETSTMLVVLQPYVRSQCCDVWKHFTLLYSKYVYMIILIMGRHYHNIVDSKTWNSPSIDVTQETGSVVFLYSDWM